MHTPDSERSQRARIAGLARSAKAPSGTAISAPARAAFLQRFYDETDPELPEAERQRQAAAARKLHMTRLSRRAAAARRSASAAARELAEVADDLAASADAV